ncbi:hypothetical protein EF888_00915 [Silicimonas algicola]|uniref:Uncharacterized protein n=1 Tax=Silicimonas algicola TaxID=1826607 RepID=A0A316G1H3_9RHOB|nr:DUF6505 family protein [Silicimonas algicola]AZQ65819.1 hypothetical protein EF888_00915 [Silicimonas algicola]PWK54804.1 hypothetical protein C8D95_11096 [Silicimonas algicola]
MFARVIRLDDSDLNVFDLAAEPGEWAVPGTFAFSNWSEDDLSGKSRQAFAHGWLGLSSFGRASVVAVTPITAAEKAALADALAAHFVAAWGAPDLDAARPVAGEEIAHMAALCEGHPENSLIVLERELTGAGVRDRFRIVPPQGAALETFAVHGD